MVRSRNGIKLFFDNITIGELMPLENNVFIKVTGNDKIGQCYPKKLHNHIIDRLRIRVKHIPLRLSVVFDRRGLLTKIVACCLSSLIACAGAQPKVPVLPNIELGRSYAQVAIEMNTSRRLPAFEFVAGTHRMALFYVNKKGVLSDSMNVATLPTVMLFEDDLYLGSLSADLALKFEVCLGQPNGPELLAERLRMLMAGKPDPLAMSLDADAPTACPTGLRPPSPKPEQKLSSQIAEGIGQSLFLSAGLVLFPFLVGIGIPVAIGEALVNQEDLGRQSGLRLGDSTEDITQLLGEPNDRFLLMSAGTEVLFYGSSPNLYLGLQGSRLIWLNRSYSKNKWLTAIRAQLWKDRKSGAGNDTPAK